MLAKEKLAAGFDVHLGAGDTSLWYQDWLGTGRLCDRVAFVNISDTLLTVSDAWRDGGWQLFNLSTILPEDIAQEIQRIHVPIDPQGLDRIKWCHTNDGKYSTRSAYQFLTQGTVIQEPWWKRIWHCNVPEKVRYFLWLIAKESLPTNVKRLSCHLAQSATCLRCGAPQEDLHHMFRECPMTVEA